MGEHRAHPLARVFDLLRAVQAAERVGSVALHLMGDGDAFLVSDIRAAVAQSLIERRYISGCTGIEWDRRPRSRRIRSGAIADGVGDFGFGHRRLGDRCGWFYGQSRSSGRPGGCGLLLLCLLPGAVIVAPDLGTFLIAHEILLFGLACLRTKLAEADGGPPRKALLKWASLLDDRRRAKLTAFPVAWRTTPTNDVRAGVGLDRRRAKPEGNLSLLKRKGCENRENILAL